MSWYCLLVWLENGLSLSASTSFAERMDFIIWLRNSDSNSWATFLTFSALSRFLPFMAARRFRSVTEPESVLLL